MAAIRALVVDDEPLARERIRALLAEDPEVALAGECANGEEAVSAIREGLADLVFLDVQMPGMDGFEVLEALGGAEIPAVVFVTAYDRHAVRAFEVHAVDYLLKPFDRDRFRKALARAKSEVRSRGAGGAEERIAALLEGLGARRRFRQRFVVSEPGRVFFVRADEIDWIESAGNYVRLHAGREVHLVRETMRAVESRLDPESFLRIRRSTIVNVDRVRDLKPLFHGGYLVTLKDGTEVVSSRGYAARLRRLASGA